MKTPDESAATANDASSRTRTTDPTDRADWSWADPRSLKVKLEFQRLIPLQARGELLAMDESIQAEGCRDPLLVWAGRGVVLDGHTRRALCIKHKKQVKVREVDLPDEKAAVAFILQLQRQRRNLTREALSYFRGAEYNALKQQRGGNRRGQQPKDQSGPKVSTAQQLAGKYGVAEMTIKRDALFAQTIDKIVAEYGDPEIKRKLLGADVKLTHSLARVLLEKPADQRQAAVAQLLLQGELPRARKGSAAATPKPRALAQSLIARLNKKRAGQAQAVFKQMARLLGFEVTEKASGQ